MQANQPAIAFIGAMSHITTASSTAPTIVPPVEVGSWL